MTHATQGGEAAAHSCMLSRLRTTIIAKGATMPCGDNSILTAFFDYLTDRATALGQPDVVDGCGADGDTGLMRAMTESRMVADVLAELAVLLEIDFSSLRTVAVDSVPASNAVAVAG